MFAILCSTSVTSSAFAFKLQYNHPDLPVFPGRSVMIYEIPEHCDKANNLGTGSLGMYPTYLAMGLNALATESYENEQKANGLLNKQTPLVAAFVEAKNKVAANVQAQKSAAANMPKLELDAKIKAEKDSGLVPALNELNSAKLTLDFVIPYVKRIQDGLLKSWYSNSCHIRITRGNALVCNYLTAAWNVEVKRLADATKRLDTAKTRAATAEASYNQSIANNPALKAAKASLTALQNAKPELDKGLATSEINLSDSKNAIEKLLSRNRAISYTTAITQQLAATVRQDYNRFCKK